MKEKEIFWLHIKKSGGQSTRAMLASHYKQVDRSKKPACFIQSERQCWNDILNNYRVPLGSLQFRRCLFAKTYLWKDEYDSLFKFAFVRNPFDRCLSQFFYLWRVSGWRRGKYWDRNVRLFKRVLSRPRVQSLSHHDFDWFLDAIEACRSSDSNNGPFSVHFQTHTADMWSDITDYEDNVLLDKIWRLEDFAEGINHVRDILGQPPLNKSEMAKENVSKRASFVLKAGQRAKIERLFAKDFELYETS